MEVLTLKRKSCVLRALLAVFAFAILTGGCGGGGDSESEIDLYSLNGTWVPHYGEGRAAPDEYNFRVLLGDPPGSATFKILTLTATDVSIEVNSKINWDVFYEGNFAFDTVVNVDEKIVATLIGKNSFQFATLNDTNIKATLISDDVKMELAVEERGNIAAPEGGGVYSYNVKYSMTK